MKIAISGAGVAGPTLAYWLHRCGHEPTLIEKAPHLRTGGYVIDFWGVGYTMAERMGILPEVLEAGYAVQELRLVDTAGRKSAGFSTEDGVRRLDPQPSDQAHDHPAGGRSLDGPEPARHYRLARLRDVICSRDGHRHLHSRHG